MSTCGEGLAHHSTLPAKMADLVAAVAKNLEAHLAAIDQRDERSRPEHDAYVLLIHQHHDIETRLRALAREMAGYAGLPMAVHDPEAMAAPGGRRAFEHLVSEERALVTMLQNWIAEHETMLRSS